MTTKSKEKTHNSTTIVKSADELLRIMRQNELILEAAGEGIYVLDQQGMTTFVNPAAAQMFGWSVEEMIGKPNHSLVHHTKPDGSHYPKQECPIYAAFKDGAVHHVDNEVFWRKDGSSFPIDYTSTPILEDGELIGAVVVFKDITERIQAQDAIDQLQRQNERILHAAGEGIFGIDTRGLITFINPAATDILGWDLGSIVGKPGHKLLHHTKSDNSPYPVEECPIYAAFMDGAIHHVDNEVFWRKDGSSFPVDYTSTPMRANGKLTGAVVVFSDITERRNAEQALEKAYAEVASMKERLEYENIYLQEEIKSQHNFKDIIGQSENILYTLKQIEMVAPTYASVLITGESGTGKELLARAIHERSDRSQRPMIRVNCAAIPQELFESEFFGHVKGSFTGALKDRAGRFELADGGTIFLDEVGEIPLELQSKLLRVLQEGECQRVGEERPRQIDIRVVAATNKDLKAAAKAKEFREDLYYRLNVFPLEAAPLRKRKEDIPLLASYFIELISGKLNRPEPKLTQGNIQQLQAYDWPGNIRELQNLIERAIILSIDGSLQFQLPGENKASSSNSFITPASDTPNNKTIYYTEAERHTRDKNNILAALEYADWKISGIGGAAELLEIKPTTLASRMKTLGIAKQ